MLAGPDLADLIAYARTRGPKIILAGDVSQPQAVENGGGTSLLAPGLATPGWPNPSGFATSRSNKPACGYGTVIPQCWPTSASTAAAAYTTLATAGTDTLLMAADHALRRELNRGIRDDLIALGIVSDGPAVRLADGTPGQSRRPHHLHPQRPHRRGRGIQPHPGQRRPAPHRGHHPGRPARPSRPGRRPAYRAAPLDRPTFPVQPLRKFQARVRGHRPRRPGPHRAHRAGRDDRHRGPSARGGADAPPASGCPQARQKHLPGTTGSPQDWHPHRSAAITAEPIARPQGRAAQRAPVHQAFIPPGPAPVHDAEQVNRHRDMPILP